MQKNKNGSNVSFVISFILFITFVIFIYALLNYRVSTSQEKSNSLMNLEEQIIPMISGNMTTTSVDVNVSTSNSCLIFSNLLSYTGIGSSVIAQDSSGNNFVANISSDSSSLYINRGGSQETFFRVYSSSEFPSVASSTGSCQALTQGNGYNIGITSTGSYVLQSKVIAVLQNYSSNYTGLKNNLKINPSDEFGFAFTYNNGTRVSTNKSNVAVNVYSERLPVQYISSSSGISNGFIDINVW